MSSWVLCPTWKWARTPQKNSLATTAALGLSLPALGFLPPVPLPLLASPQRFSTFQALSWPGFSAGYAVLGVWEAEDAGAFPAPQPSPSLCRGSGRGRSLHSSDPRTVFPEWGRLDLVQIQEQRGILWGWVGLNSPGIFFGLPRWLSGKESAFQCSRHGFNP